MLVSLVAGVRGFVQVLVYGLATFALSGIARQFVLGARARRRVERRAWPLVIADTVRGNPRLYGGLIVHVGVVLIAIALATSGSSSTRREVRLERGESATVAGYTVTYLGSTETRGAQNSEVKARVHVEHDGDDLGVYAPSIKSFPGTTQGIGTPSVRTGIFRDVYLTLISSPNERGRVTLGVAVNPMVVWLWIGGGVLALGTVVALAPSLRRRARGAPAPSDPQPRATAPDDEPTMERVPA
jgi:cytochrome c-type biogenesis protein CcmF